MEKAEEISEKTSFNKIVQIGKNSKIGVVTSGVSFNYVKEVAEELNLNVKILKLGMSHPIPKKMCGDFIKSCSKIAHISLMID